MAVNCCFQVSLEIFNGFCSRASQQHRMHEWFALVHSNFSEATSAYLSCPVKQKRLYMREVDPVIQLYVLFGGMRLWTIQPDWTQSTSSEMGRWVALAPDRICNICNTSLAESGTWRNTSKSCSRRRGSLVASQSSWLRRKIASSAWLYLRTG